MASFIQRLYVGEGKLVLHLSAVLDEYGSVFLIDLVAHGGHHRLVLGKGGESVLSGSLHILVCLLFPVGSQYLVNGFLRASALVVVYNLPAVGCDARGDDVQVGDMATWNCAFCIRLFREVYSRRYLTSSSGVGLPNVPSAPKFWISSKRATPFATFRSL